MKKFIVLLAGLMLSIYSIAANVYKTETEININGDPYTCSIQAELKCKLSAAKTIRYYRYTVYGFQEITEAYNKKSYTVTTEYVNETYVVASSLNGPSSHSAPSKAPAQYNDHISVNDDELPVMDDYPVTQYDIYYVHKGTPIVEHDIKLKANMFTKKAKYQLFSTHDGQDEEGNYYCNHDFVNTYLMYNKDRTQQIELSSVTPLTGKGQLTLAPSNNAYEYYVFAVSPVINAPAHKDYVPDPQQSSYNYYWGDHFRITVLQPECMPNLVYRKWDNLMFVDNGKNGGDGRFVRYQWYKDQDPIEGATKQWYRFEDIPSIERYLFYAECFFEDGSSIFTCPTMFQNMPKSTNYNSHGYIGAPAHKELQNGQLIIELDGVKYNAQGMKIQ